MPFVASQDEVSDSLSVSQTLVEDIKIICQEASVSWTQDAKLQGDVTPIDVPETYAKSATSNRKSMFNYV